ncbi:hypothetical protein SK128_012832 [Halocaridina rubra]|uniref:Uncharacterized protein n=1 Tax=Halocaridina rubra TaxID=373956 RepID=A0AAN8X0B1_HALRR
MFSQKKKVMSCKTCSLVKMNGDAAYGSNNNIVSLLDRFKDTTDKNRQEAIGGGAYHYHDRADKCGLCSNPSNLSVTKVDGDKIEEAKLYLNGQNGITCLQCKNILVCSTDKKIDYLLNICKQIKSENDDEEDTIVDNEEKQLINNFNRMVDNELND